MAEDPASSAPSESGSDQSVCAAPDPAPRAPAVPFPELACDCHAHVFGPADRYPYSAQRVYTPPDAPLAAYEAVAGTLGLSRAVLVQPSVYGSDNSMLIDALVAATIPVRGIAVVSDEVSDAELARLDQAGVRGLRFNLVDVAEGAPAPSIESIGRLAERVAVMDWHVELLLHVDEYPDLEERFTGFPVEIVLGHMGFPRPGAGPQDPGFLAMMRLARQGLCWIKMTGPYRLSQRGAPYPEAAALVAALVDTAPNRLLWGTDWPHVMVDRDMPNDGELCDLLALWIPDADLRRQILVLNPAALYGFEF